MLQNKIYQNFTIEILKTFSVILFGLSVIALTVRAVNFLDLIVDSGYPVSTYFQYSVLNLFGIAPKFIPLSFLVALMIFVLKHIQDSEFIILWTSGVRKLQVVHLLLATSVLLMIFDYVLLFIKTMYYSLFLIIQYYLLLYFLIYSLFIIFLIFVIILIHCKLLLSIAFYLFYHYYYLLFTIFQCVLLFIIQTYALFIIIY